MNFDRARPLRATHLHERGASMGMFEFIIVIVLIASGFEMLTKIGVALASRRGERSGRGQIGDSERAGPGGLEAIEELEQRLARIEERLDFLEELRAPPERPALSAGGTGAKPSERPPGGV